jgi:hypothetical protein
VHEPGAAAAAHQLVALVVGAVLEHDDPGVGPRLRRPRLHHLRLDADRVPGNTGAGNTTSVIPSCATMVPSVSSGTERPTTSATVNMLLTSGRPNSVPAA